jgi:hypothetical protein
MTGSQTLALDDQDTRLISRVKMYRVCSPKMIQV